MNHYDSSGKLTKTVSKQLFKWDAPAFSHSCVNTHIIFVLLMSYSCYNTQHWCTDAVTPFHPRLRVTWDGPCELRLVLQAVSYQLGQMGSTPLTGASAPPPPHQPMTSVEKKWCMQMGFVTTWRGKGAPGVEKKRFKEIMFIVWHHPRPYDSSPWPWNEKSAAVLPSVTHLSGYW